MLTRLTALEFQNAVMLDDVLVVLQRAEMTTRMAEEIERDCVELGTEGRLIRMQLEELVAEVPAERAAVVLDYQVGEASTARETLDAAGGAAATTTCSSSTGSRELLGYPRSVNPLDHSVAPRGFRVLSHIPRLPTRDQAGRPRARRARVDRPRDAARARGRRGRRFRTRA